MSQENSKKMENYCEGVRKFFQKYTISSKEEAYVILRNYTGFDAPEDRVEYLDEDLCNLFTTKDNFLKDEVVSNCYIVSNELDDTLCSWVSSGYSSYRELEESEGVSLEDACLIERTLYEKFTQGKSLSEFITKDKEDWSNDVDWYDTDSLIQKFCEFAKNN